MPDNILWHVRGQGLIAGQAPARRIRAPHMKFATGDCITLMPQQTAYILQVILAQFGRLAARSCTFRTRSTLSLRGLLIPSSGRRRRRYYGKTTPLMVWYPRAPPSPTLADPMLLFGSDGEHRLWRHGTRLEAVRDHKWHYYYGNEARRNRTHRRPVTYSDGKSDFRRRKHLGIRRVFGPVCLLQRGLPRKKIRKKILEGASKFSLNATDGPDGHLVGGVLFTVTWERHTQERRLQGVTTSLDSLRCGTLSEQAHGTLEGITYGSLGLSSIVCSDSSTRASVAECKLRGKQWETRWRVRASRRGQAEEGIGGWKDPRDSRAKPACWKSRDTAQVRPASHTQLNRPVRTSWSATTTFAGMAASSGTTGANAGRGIEWYSEVISLHADELPMGALSDPYTARLISERAHGTLEGTTYGSLGLNSIFCSDSSTRASVAECKLRGNLREMRLQVRASCRGQAEEGIGGWKDSRDFRVRPACWIFRDTDLVRPASHTLLNRPVTKSRSSRATLIGSMAEAWDVAGDVWDSGGGTQAGPVRWMDGGPSQAMPAASTLLHCEEPQHLTAARTSKHMDLVGTVGAVTEGAVTWMTSGSISQRGAEAASDKLCTAVSHERKL